MLKSAFDDLRQTTLAKIEGTWGKLSYVFERRASDGHYEHWGFERTHGNAAAQQTFARTHRSLVDTILRTRLSSLHEDLRQSSAAVGANPAFFVSKLDSDRSRLLPAGSLRMTELHLISVLKTLELLEARMQPDSRSA